ncbi:hypothetical protein [Desulfurivibrio sp. C05AmB]|uniref:hypothetical protein n=1 Tax=Desulfurivibrio sp. C05AmB TaxID=3374371 RepID=UPI00376F1F7F
MRDTQHDSLLGHLALRLASHPENIATEALTYLLDGRRGAVLRRAFLKYVQDKIRAVEPSFQLPENTFFSSQERGDDGGIPDIIGKNGDDKILIIEAKFGAGLTANQPVGYLGHLKGAGNGVLMFVAPENRLETLWFELGHRCKKSVNHDFIGETKRPASGKFIVSKLISGQFLALTSWREILDYLKKAAIDEPQLSNNIAQLSGLCERMDAEAFLPLTSEDITSQAIPRCQLQFYDIVDKVFYKVVYKVKENVPGEPPPTGKSCNAGYGYYARSFSFYEFGLNIQLDYTIWRKYGLSPIWLSVRKNDSGNPTLTTKVQNALSQLPDDRLFYTELKTHPAAYIPLLLPVGKELEAVLENLSKQIEEVLSLLEKQSERKTP